jgi:4-hydroxybenzoate polyprenyltransferase
MNGDDNRNGKLPLLFRLPTAVALAVLGLVLCAPVVAAALAGRHPGLALTVGLTACAGYLVIRWESKQSKRRGFGPLWLEMVDMAVVFGNIGAILFACWRIVAQLIWKG